MCLIEARPSVLVIFALRFTAGAVLGAPTAAHGHLVRAIASVLIWVLAIFVTYLLNGVTDLRADRLNEIRRPIARGDLSPAAALRVSIGAAVLAFAGSLAIGAPASYTVPAVLVLGCLYSGPPWHLKRWSAATGLIVTFAGLLAYYTGYAAYTGGPAGSGTVLPTFAAAMSLWMGLVGATTKDVSDITGDTATGRRTNAVILGERRARLFAAASSIAIATVFLGVALRFATPLTWAAGNLMAGAVAVAVLSLSRRSHGTRSRRRLPYRAFMVTQYSVHVSAVLPHVTCTVLSIC